MAIKKKEEMPTGPIEIDLTGPDGNVFALMGYARNYAKQIWGHEMHPNSDAKYGDYICNKMMESDYENAVHVFDHYFGSFVILYR